MADYTNARVNFLLASVVKLVYNSLTQRHQYFSTPLYAGIGFGVKFLPCYFLLIWFIHGMFNIPMLFDYDTVLWTPENRMPITVQKVVAVCSFLTMCGIGHWWFIRRVINPAVGSAFDFMRNCPDEFGSIYTWFSIPYFVLCVITVCFTQLIG